MKFPPANVSLETGAVVPIPTLPPMKVAAAPVPLLTTFSTVPDAPAYCWFSDRIEDVSAQVPADCVQFEEKSATSP